MKKKLREMESIARGVGDAELFYIGCPGRSLWYGEQIKEHFK